MKIALVGYGKMGKAIEEIAVSKGHEIVVKINIDNLEDFSQDNLRLADVAIEFTGPQSAVGNIKQCIRWGIPVVSGSTGWLEQWNEVEYFCKQHNGGLVYASNYSIGVNLFFELNKKLADLMKNHTEYKASLEEIHHTEKKDAPSGTAITLAEQILIASSIKKQWVNRYSENPEDLVIQSKRVDPAAGTHSVRYDSDIDDIQITHTAHNRKGFAGGAVLAAEFIPGRTGIYSMKDVLHL